MNSYPMFLRQLERGNLRYDSLTVRKSRFLNALSHLKENAYSCICFDAGESETLANLLPIKGKSGYIDLAFLNPPFPVTWVEFDGLSGFDGAKCAVFATSAEHERYWFTFVKIPELDNQWFLEGCVGYSLGKPQSIMLTDDVNQEYNRTHFAILGTFVGAMLALKCHNVVAIEEKPSQLQKMRAKKHGLPTFSTWTLRIKQERRQPRTTSVGSHESPRLHLRRGHIREYHPGKFTWVSSCVVGSVDKGIVAKDYAIEVSS